MTSKYRNPNRHAFTSEALMVRALHAYREARNKAEHDGVDLSADPVPPSFADMSDRYDRLLNDWATEKPETAGDMLAYLDLVAAIVDDERSDQRGDLQGVILSVERDFGHALQLLTSVRRRLNEQDIKDAVQEERERLGVNKG
jgi:hypothetical protein